MIPHVHIEYHNQDKEFAETLTHILRKNDICVQCAAYNNNSNYKEHVESLLKENDSIIWILSRITEEKKLLRYYHEIALIEEKEQNKRLLPIYIEERLPIFKFSENRNRFFITRTKTVEENCEELIRYLKINAGQVVANDKFRKKCRSDALIQLKNAYKEKYLVLFCGAGISIGSGIPSWNKLLVSMFLEISKLSSDYTDVLCDKLKNELFVSQEMLARMIKQSDCKCFYERIQRNLYKGLNKDWTNTIHAIVELCSSNSRNEGVKEIITYNFDDLLERNFKENGIKYTHSHGDGIPIHHVHGFLPQESEVSFNRRIVFSEDEYHKQYADLTNNETIKQLGVLDENICLYVGISFTDPNMRRLADAYIKEHQDRQTPHYLIKKIPDIHLNNENRFLSETKLLNQIMCLEELDAKSFGFQIIWLDNFDEIPQLFNDIKDKQNE